MFIAVNTSYNTAVISSFSLTELGTYFKKIGFQSDIEDIDFSKTYLE